MIQLSDRYAIQQQLGKKAGRKTVLARDNETQELVVIKILSFNSDFEWDDLRLFEREAKTLQSLNHPAIPCYLDYFELNSPTGKEFALVQSYIPAKSLDQHLKAGRNFSEAEVKELAKSLLEILIYLHEKQPPIIHRDIKPSNILLSDRSGHSIGQVYLVDFGSVQNLAAKESGTMTVVGTYGYMPPEQFGDRAVPASDLYSLGATLIYLVTGSHPADLPQVDLVIQFEQATNLTPEFSYWLKQMTDPSLNRRFSSVEKALQTLEKPQLLSRESSQFTLRKPAGSKIKLDKNSEKIVISTPILGQSSNKVNLITFIAIVFTIHLVIYPVPGGIFVLTFFDLIIIGCYIRHYFFTNTHLSIDKKTIVLEDKTFVFKHNIHKKKRKDIYKLVQISPTYKYDQNNRVTKEVSPGIIIIWVGIQKLEIKATLTSPELDWLAAELSDWLKLPISRE